MTFAAVTSLKNTIQCLLNSSCISIVSPSREILEFAHEDVKSLQKVLERFDKSRNSSERVKALEGKIRETVRKLEDMLEFHVADQLFSQSESLSGDDGRSLILSLDVQELRQDIDCFTDAAKKMEEEYIKELDNTLPEEEDDDVVSSRTDVGGRVSEMVGLTDEFCYIREDFVMERPVTSASNWYVPFDASIVGMAGIGKTTLAKKIFEDPLILENFECRAFVRVGQRYQLKEKLKAILAQVNADSDKMIKDGEENIDEYLWISLIGRKYFIVLDDVWNTDSWDAFRSRLPKEDNGSIILVTTRVEQLAKSIHIYGEKIYTMRFLNEEESWHLLRGKVFAEGLCPPQLEKAGKKIAKNCEGLPLLILTVADLVSKAEKTPEYWNKVAADKENSVFIDAYDQISKVLYPSYNYLPHYLKACFLYMGAFPQNYDVRPSKIINLWSAEGFLEPNPYETFESFVEKCFEHLVSSNLFMVHRRSYYHNKVKAYSLHSVFWHLSKREAGKNKFLHILNSFADALAEGIESQRRLSIYKNILFCIKDVYDAIASISTARSLFCTSALHQYQVPMCYCLRLLKVLDALTIRFYEFPMEVLKLVQLRYLAFTYNGNLSPSISKLWNLQYLIVYKYLSIKSTIAESFLPMEIWNLQELKYLQIMGRNLPNPPRGAVLPNLSTLLDVGAHSCTKGVLESIPNLKKLRVHIELAPDGTQPLSCFDHICHLYSLNSLKCVVVNPKLKSEIVVPPSPFSVFTSCLQKLTLSGFGYPWKEMNRIAELPLLQVLKLQCYAFQGQKLDVKKGFLELKYLSIEDTDLVQWTAEAGTFPLLRYVTMKNCYKLREIPNIYSVLEFKLFDCNHLGAAYAKRMITRYRKIYSYSSWDDGRLSHY